MAHPLLISGPGRAIEYHGARTDALAISSIRKPNVSCTDPATEHPTAGRPWPSHRPAFGARLGPNHVTAGAESALRRREYLSRSPPPVASLTLGLQIRIQLPDGLAPAAVVVLVDSAGKPFIKHTTDSPKNPLRTCPDAISGFRGEMYSGRASEGVYDCRAAPIPPGSWRGCLDHRPLPW
jgi:hypothetical protein